jgi:hypothetical protein
MPPRLRIWCRHLLGCASLSRMPESRASCRVHERQMGGPAQSCLGRTQTEHTLRGGHGTSVVQLPRAVARPYQYRCCCSPPLPPSLSPSPSSVLGTALAFIPRKGTLTVVGRRHRPLQSSPRLPRTAPTAPQNDRACSSMHFHEAPTHSVHAVGRWTAHQGATL